MYCSKCGRQIAEGAAFCSGCGTAAGKASPPGSAVQNTQVSEPLPAGGQKKRKGWLIALIALGGVALLAACIVIGIWVIPQLNQGKKHPSPAPSSSQPATMTSVGSAPPAAKAGFNPPVPGEGESLYIGAASFDGIGIFKAAFVLSADGGTIHDMTIYAENLKVKIKQGNSTTSVTLNSLTETYRGTYPVGETETRIDLGKSKINNLVFTDGGAYGEIAYVYVHRNLNGGSSVDVPMGTSVIEFSKSADTAETAPAAEEPAPTAGESAPATEETPTEDNTPGKTGETAQVVFEDKTYTVSIGQINKNGDGSTTVEVCSTGIGSVLPFRNGKLIVPVQAKVVTNGKEIGWKTVQASADSLIFVFPTNQTPEKIILYPNGKQDDPGAAVTFDANTKKVIS